MNVWCFTGRLGADAELRNTQSGSAVLGFRVANDVGFGDRRTTQWVECSLWGKRGESLADYLVKGTQVAITGELSLKTFEKRDGTSGATLAVNVTDVTLVGGKPEGGGERRPQDGRGGYGDTGGRSGGSGRGSARRPADDDLDDEIPF